jgi:hypothetical protein
VVPGLFIPIGTVASHRFVFYGGWRLWNVLVHGLENNYQHFVYCPGNFNCAVFVSEPAAKIIFRFVT